MTLILQEITCYQQISKVQLDQAESMKHEICEMHISFRWLLIFLISRYDEQQHETIDLSEHQELYIIQIKCKCAKCSIDNVFICRLREKTWI
uniref:Uncharacterized protein n=1 Tax=Arundo donax TaxID=35708 RepID=A0A0A9DYT6_ARUDO